MKVTLTVKGTPVAREVEPRQSLVDSARTELQLTGSHVGCEHGVCGACTVRVDGKLVRGCLMLAIQADGARVETIEGLAESGALTDLQRAFRGENALAVRVCTPGHAAHGARAAGAEAAPGPRDHPRGLGANYCRCTGHHAIVQAISRTAERRAGFRPRAATAENDGAGDIGRTVARPQTARLVAGRGTYTDDVVVPRLDARRRSSRSPTPTRASSPSTPARPKALAG